MNERKCFEMTRNHKEPTEVKNAEVWDVVIEGKHDSFRARITTGDVIYNSYAVITTLRSSPVKEVRNRKQRVFNLINCPALRDPSDA